MQVAPVQEGQQHPSIPLTDAQGALRLESIGKYFEEGDHWAVRHLELQVQPGEFFGLLGPSGCGKTTTLNMIAGFVQPTEGTISFGGRDVTAVAAHRRGATMVFQDYALFPHLTARENVAFGMKVQKASTQHIKERTDQLLGMVDLGKAADKLPGQLSGGQQQRVAIARALAVDPSIVLLDEPLSNLDARLRAEVRLELKQLLRAAGVTVILVTHDQSEAFSVCDRVAVMFSGRVASVGAPDTVYRLPPTREVAEFVGEANFFDAIVTAVAGSRVATVQITVAGRTHVVNAEFATGTVQPGDVGHVLFRPESLTVVPVDDEPESDEIIGTVIDASFLGEFVSYELDLGGQSARVKQVYVRQVLSPGARVALSWAEDTAIFIPAEMPG